MIYHISEYAKKQTNYFNLYKLLKQTTLVYSILLLNSNIDIKLELIVYFLLKKILYYSYTSRYYRHIYYI